MLALIFLARRIQPFLSPVDRESNFVYERTNRSPLVGHFFFSFFCEEKFQFVCLHRDSNSRPNVRGFRGYQLNHQDDRGVNLFNTSGGTGKAVTVDVLQMEPQIELYIVLLSIARIL